MAIHSSAKIDQLSAGTRSRLKCQAPVCPASIRSPACAQLVGGLTPNPKTQILNPELKPFVQAAAERGGLPDQPPAAGSGHQAHPAGGADEVGLLPPAPAVPDRQWSAPDSHCTSLEYECSFTGSERASGSACLLIQLRNGDLRFAGVSDWGSNFVCVHHWTCSHASWP